MFNFFQMNPKLMYYMWMVVMMPGLIPCQPTHDDDDDDDQCHVKDDEHRELLSLMLKQQQMLVRGGFISLIS